MRKRAQHFANQPLNAGIEPIPFLSMNTPLCWFHKAKYQLLAAACALLMLGDLSYANPTTEKASDILYSKSVVFKEFHDPGRLISANGKEYFFYYKGFTYDNIKTWKEGRELTLTYSNTKGSQLHDPLSGASARVQSTNVIEEITRERAKTVGAAWAYRDEYELWDAMIAQLLKELKASRTPDDYKDIEDMHNSWLEYKEMRFKVGRSEFSHRSGTHTLLESNVRAVAAIKHQALFLRSLVVNGDP